MPVVLCVGGVADGSRQRVDALEEGAVFEACNPYPGELRVLVKPSGERVGINPYQVEAYRVWNMGGSQDGPYFAAPASWEYEPAARLLAAGYQAGSFGSGR